MNSSRARANPTGSWHATFLLSNCSMYHPRHLRLSIDTYLSIHAISESDIFIKLTNY